MDTWPCGPGPAGEERASIDPVAGELVLTQGGLLKIVRTSRSWPAFASVSVALVCTYHQTSAWAPKVSPLLSSGPIDSLIPVFLLGLSLILIFFGANVAGPDPALVPLVNGPVMNISRNGSDSGQQVAQTGSTAERCVGHAPIWIGKSTLPRGLAKR